jgi:VanZ family protein
LRDPYATAIGNGSSPPIKVSRCASPVIAVLRVLTWCGVILLAVLSLLPGQWLAALSLLPLMEMVRTVFPAPLEHFIAYAGMAAIAMAGYGSGRVNVRIIGGLCVYAGILEYTRDFSPGRHPAIARFVGSALGALCGGLAVAFLSGTASSASGVEGLSSSRRSITAAGSPRRAGLASAQRYRRHRPADRSREPSQVAAP